MTLDLITDRTGGFYNAADLNRVGDAVQQLADALNAYTYTVTVSPVIGWGYGDIPTPAERQKYLDDVQAIKDAFYGTVALPNSLNKLTAEDANNIERLLLEVEAHINNMVATFRPSGTFAAGQANILPRRVM